MKIKEIIATTIDPEIEPVGLNGPQFILQPCPLCNCTRLKLTNEVDYLNWYCTQAVSPEQKLYEKNNAMEHTWFVSCDNLHCGVCGPRYFVGEFVAGNTLKTDKECWEHAISSWNSRPEKVKRIAVENKYQNCQIMES